MHRSAQDFNDLAARRPVVLDGAVGTMIQSLNICDEDYRYDGFGPEARPAGLNDVLCLSRPELIRGIHAAYIAAGADIVTTDSFNANAVSLAEYGLDAYADVISRAAASVARQAADESGRKVLVAGSMGPTSKSLSMADAATPDFDTMESAYAVQAEALARGGADLWLIETVFDALNAKAAISGCMRAADKLGYALPIIISATLTEQGRTLGGQTIAAFVASVAHARPAAICLNCGFGIGQLAPYVRELAAIAPCAVGVYPNAGLPNAMGGYDESPATMAAQLKPLLDDAVLNLVGGCCGTTPDHIRAVAELAHRAAPRPIPAPAPRLVLSGFEALDCGNEDFVRVGERCNVAGSRKFLKLINAGDTAGALDVARSQVEAGAAVMDVNMDDPMLDDPGAVMESFVGELVADATAGRVPVMVDSSDFNVIVRALKRIPGRCIVNSISLKEGEAVMLDRARQLRRLGAVPVVMAFDERGQADTLDRRVEICTRAYKLLTRAGFDGSEIIFDPNVLTVATGMPEHDRYALDFIEATRRIRATLPGAHVSGGVSNLSFAFRGNEPVRRAMHSVFLHHARQAGMDMAIVNPSALPQYESIDPELRQAVEDVILCRRGDATERLTALAAEIKASAEAAKGNAPKAAAPQPAATATVEQRIAAAVVNGVADGIEPLLDQAMAKLGSPLAVVEQTLMAGMDTVGELFGSGRMFLPQVVRSAGVMKAAVKHLTPFIRAGHNEGTAPSQPVIVMATVKGDVHDIGKNIVNVVLECNGFKVVDLGVMVEADTIIDAAVDNNAAAIGLSGLITPSLAEMCRVAALMEERGLDIPLFVGGATVSAEYAAVRLAPCRPGHLVAYTRDAADLPVVARRLLSAVTGPAAAAELKQRQEELRAAHGGRTAAPLRTLDEARATRSQVRPVPSPTPVHPGITDLSVKLDDLVPYINWKAFFAAWGLDASLGSIAAVGGCDHCRAQWLAAEALNGRADMAAKAMQLYKEALRELSALTASGAKAVARVALLPAASDVEMPDTLSLYTADGRVDLPMLRSQTPSPDGRMYALTDWIAPTGDDGNAADWCGAFAVSCGDILAAAIDNAAGDDYRMMLLQTLADRVAEAATEWMHRQVRTRLWGYADEAGEPPVTDLLKCGYRGIRPAVGYPSIPDQSLMLELDKILHYDEIGILVTENGALKPSASTSGLLLAHPHARYFAVGRIAADQRADYAARRTLTPDRLNDLLPL